MHQPGYTYPYLDVELVFVFGGFEHLGDDYMYRREDLEITHKASFEPHGGATGRYVDRAIEPIVTFIMAD